MTPDNSRHSHRLAALTRIVREVDAASDLDSALGVIVRRTREVMAADVCTIYFTDHEQRRHVFAATDGLSPELVGHVQAGFGQGLIGQVADSSHPVNLAQVPKELDREFLDTTHAGSPGDISHPVAGGAASGYRTRQSTLAATDNQRHR